MASTMIATLLPLLALLPSTLATPLKRQIIETDAGLFTHSQTFTFEGTEFPEGLYPSNYIVPDDAAPYDHFFRPANAYVADGYLNLLVNGGQTTSPLYCGEVGTTETAILYASVRTVAVFDDVPGVCSASFFYLDPGRQEIDIEWLSDATSLSNPGDGSRPFLYTNQDVNGVFEDRTWGYGESPADLTQNEHEYRIDWVPGATRFFVDGDLREEYTTDVPTQPGSWLWNNWANGDLGWTGNPPAEDNVFRIRSIEMYYNVSGSA